MKTSNNTVFISGGSAGIGLEIAKKLLAEGNKIIINGRNETRLIQALQQLPGAVGIMGDLSIESDRIRIANDLISNHKDLNIVINNAGAVQGYLLNETKNAHEKAKIEMNTNYFAIIHFNELLLPHLIEKSEAAIINVTSIAIYGSHQYLPTYSASKAALHNYTLALRLTYKANNNLKFFEVIPPLVNTEFSAEIGGENGIPASEVADELLIGLENNQLDIPVGESKIYANAIKEAFNQLSVK